MNKSKLFFKTCFLAVAMCAAGIAANAQVFVIERGAQFQSFANIYAAVEALQNGDKIYIPPGTHGTTGNNITLDVPNVTIIGAGYDNGADASRIGVAVIFAADGITVTGINFINQINIQAISNLNMARCLVEFVSTTGIQNSILISECDFRGSFGSPPYGLNNATISKSIFRHQTFSVSASVINNCLFMRHTSASYPLDVRNSTLTNNIIVAAGFTGQYQYNISQGETGYHTTYQNNLWVGIEPVFHANAFITLSGNNIFEAVYEDTFNNPDLNDFSLKAGSAGIGAGTDNTDIGLFGTAAPFKTSKLPAIPHFSLRNITDETDETGNLRVNIRIEAQER